MIEVIEQVARRRPGRNDPIQVLSPEVLVVDVREETRPVPEA